MGRAKTQVLSVPRTKTMAICRPKGYRRSSRSSVALIPYWLR